VKVGNRVHFGAPLAFLHTHYPRPSDLHLSPPHASLATRGAVACALLARVQRRRAAARRRRRALQHFAAIGDNVAQQRGERIVDAGALFGRHLAERHAVIEREIRALGGRNLGWVENNKKCGSEFRNDDASNNGR
jgi:hypothetical protein